MSDHPSNSTWLIDVDAGHHSRPALPVAVEIPIELEAEARPRRPLLVREGRRRPIPCQLSRAGSRLIAHFLAAPMKAGEHQRYLLSFGQRHRESPARLGVAAGSTGWVIQDHELRIATVQAPEIGASRILLEGPDGPLAELTHTTSELATGRRLVRASDVNATSGAVFASVDVQYRHLDSTDRCALLETMRLRVFVAERGTRLIDLHVRWDAVAEGVTLFSPDSSVPSSLPVLQIEWMNWDEERIVSATGRRGAWEVLGRVEESVAFESPLVRLGVVCVSATLGYPPVWIGQEVEGRGRLQLIPNLPDKHWLGSPIRLALGESLSMDYKLVIEPLHGSWAERSASLIIEPVIVVAEVAQSASRPENTDP